MSPYRFVLLTVEQFDSRSYLVAFSNCVTWLVTDQPDSIDAPSLLYKISSTRLNKYISPQNRKFPGYYKKHHSIS